MAVECINPGEIREGDLIAYLDGTAPAGVSSHVARCPACAADVVSMRKTQALITASMIRVDCPATDELLEYQAGLLGKKDAQRIKRHVQGCADCQHELAELAAPLVTANRLSLLERLRLAGQEILTAMLLPPAPQPAFALRGGEQHRYEYGANGYRVQLVLSAAESAVNGWQIEGRIAQDNPSQPLLGTVTLWQADALIVSEELNEFGFFVFENIRVGDYSLHLELPASRTLVVIENLHLAQHHDT